MPPNLELVSRDSGYITVRDKESGLVNHLWIDSDLKANPGWDIKSTSSLRVADSISDTCFTFQGAGTIPNGIRYKLFGDADQNGLTEVVGLYAGREYIYEYAGYDTFYNYRDMVRPGYAMDYGKDTDGDGKKEMMTSHLGGMVLYESPDSFSLPTDSVFIWPWYMGAETIRPGGFTDLDGDGIVEVSFRAQLSTITALRCTGDNRYDLAYTIPPPDSLEPDNYYDYIWGDMDGDGRSEVVTPGVRGRFWNSKALPLIVLPLSG